MDEYVEKVKQLVSLACDRNIVVYDSQDTEYKITNRLLSLIEGPFGHYTSILCRKNKVPKFSELDFENQHIRFKGIEDARWDEVEEFYLNDLKACYAGGDNNLLLAINTDEEFNKLDKIGKVGRSKLQEDSFREKLTLASF